MRKTTILLQMFSFFGAIIATIVAVVKFPPGLEWIKAAVIMAMVFLNLLGILFMTLSINDKYWYLSYEKLIKILAEADEDWKLWNKRLKIIGEHEAIKLLKAEKEKENGST